MKKILIPALLSPLTLSALVVDVQKINNVPTLRIDKKAQVPLILYHVVGGKPVYKKVKKADDPSAELLKMCSKKKNITEYYSLTAALYRMVKRRFSGRLFKI